METKTHNYDQVYDLLQKEGEVYYNPKTHIIQDLMFMETYSRVDFPVYKSYDFPKTHAKFMNILKDFLVIHSPEKLTELLHDRDDVVIWFWKLGDTLQVSIIGPKKDIPETTPLETFVESIDWELFRIQKEALANIHETKITHKEENAINGILNLLDSFQDMLVDKMGFEEDKIFGNDI